MWIEIKLADLSKHPSLARIWLGMERDLTSEELRTVHDTMKSEDTRASVFAHICEIVEKKIKRESDKEPMSDCCGAPFGHPDSDLCSECYEHAGVADEEDIKKRFEGADNRLSIRPSMNLTDAESAIKNRIQLTKRNKV